MVWFETPSNPLLKVIDIEAICHIVKSHCPECIVVVDNTVPFTVIIFFVHFLVILYFLKTVIVIFIANNKNIYA